MSLRTIPSYELYGDLLSGRHTDPVHHETIRERSSQHDWTIRLHRHRSLTQVFLFRTDNVSFRIEDVSRTTTEPHVLFIPAGVVHGFRFNEDVEGDVLSFRANELGDKAVAMLDAPALRSACIMTHSTSENFDQMETLFGQIRPAYHGMKVERSDLLATLTQLVLIYISGDAQRRNSIGAIGKSDRPTRHETQAEDFCSLVEAHFRDALSVSDYGEKLAVSAPHLTRVCKSVLGSTPNELVRQRRLLEAKRLLEYTRLSVAEVAHRAGFHDPSFFSRTFRRVHGVSPKAYRHEKAHISQVRR